MRLRNLFFAGASVLVAACMSHAANISITPTPVDKGGVLPDHVTTDILVTTDDILRGQQLILELTAGSIYQNSFGGNAPPNSALFPLAPELPFDTFVAAGTRQMDATRPVLEVGGAVDIQPGAALKFDTEGLNIAWAPGTGVNIPAGADIPMARITLSNDAMGSFRYFSSTADGTELDFDPIPITNGIFGDDVGVPPVAVDADLGDIANAIITHQFTTSAGDPPISWGNLQSTGGSPSVAATLGADGAFEWHTIGSPRPGVYSWTADATNDSGSDTATLTLNLIVPEPATVTLLGLAMVGLVGLGRRRIG